MHPEAAYFTTMGGQRTMIAVFDMKAPTADMPRIAEPLFMGLGAAIEFMPCMNADDLPRPDCPPSRNARAAARIG